MFFSPVVALLGFYLSAATAVELQSFSPSFASAGLQGCIAVADNADGAPLIIHDCNTESPANQDWSLSFYTREPAGPQPITIFGDKCIDVTNGVNADGTKLQIWTCVEGSPNQQWTSFSDNTLQWSGTDKCIDLTNGLITDGNVLQIWTCATGNQNQAWEGTPDPDNTQVVTLSGGDISAGSPPYCITAESNEDGAEVVLANCEFKSAFPNGNITWTVATPPLTGSIVTFGNKCLDVPNGSNENGVKLQIWTCTAGNTNQIWTVHNGDSHIEWNGTGKCLDLTNGNSASGTPIQLWDCAVPDNNPNQDWWRGELTL
ncbi:ricin B lectin domain-containing protein [Mycena haematopus]|nr:ricin B lectin domain-containing protein [Mycena haematopus]